MGKERRRSAQGDVFESKKRNERAQSTKVRAWGVTPKAQRRLRARAVPKRQKINGEKGGLTKALGLARPSGHALVVRGGGEV